MQAEKKELVDIHNELRAKVANGFEMRGVGGVRQPHAANMRKLSWNDELAKIAQTLVYYILVAILRWELILDYLPVWLLFYDVLHPI